MRNAGTCVEAEVSSLQRAAGASRPRRFFKDLFSFDGLLDGAIHRGEKPALVVFSRGPLNQAVVNLV
jgi:hypothetical protein